MEVNHFQKNLTKQEEVSFLKYLDEKVDSIKNLLGKFAEDAQLLKVSIEKFDKHNAYGVEFCVVLPSKTLIATETSHDMNKAVDLAKDRTVSQIKKHLAHLRKDRQHRTIRDDHEAAIAMEQKLFSEF